MKAMVFAAGFGSRLGSLTEKTPKALIEVGGQCIIDHVLTNLSKAGISDIMINLHYLPKIIKEHVLSKFGNQLNIHFSLESEILGTGGGLLQCKDFFKDETLFVIHNCDIFCPIDLGEYFKKHTPSAMASLLCKKRETNRPLLINKENDIIGWKNIKKETGELFFKEQEVIPIGFTGIHVCTPKIFEYLDQDDPLPSSIMTGYFNGIKAGNSVKCIDIGQNYWVDMGTPKRLNELRTYLASASCF